MGADSAMSVRMDEIVKAHSFKTLGAPVNTTGDTTKIGVKMATYSFTTITTLLFFGMVWFVSKERFKLDCLYREGNGKRYAIIDEEAKKTIRCAFVEFEL